MDYRTSTHDPAPTHIDRDGRLIPTAPLIARQDTVRLAALGLYPHVTTDDPAPLGYTDWRLDGDQYVRDPAGTDDERAAALAAQSVAAVVSRFQARAALHLAGLLPAVETLMNDPATPMLARLAWADAQEFRRTSPTVLAMAAALDLTDEQLDELFNTAAGIDA